MPDASARRFGPRVPCQAWSSLVIALCAGCAGVTVTPTASDELTVPQQGAVSVVLQAASGQHFDLADHRGKALLVLAFTTDHVPSQALVQSLERVARRHPDGLAVVAIAGDTGTPVTLRVVLDTYRDVLGLTRVTLALASADVRNGTSALGEIEHVPTLYFINRAGVVVRRFEALLTEAQLEALIAPAIPSGG